MKRLIVVIFFLGISVVGFLLLKKNTAVVAEEITDVPAVTVLSTVRST